MASSVYQSKEFKNALKNSGHSLANFSDECCAVERERKLPFIGKKKNIQARGTFSPSELKEFKKLAKGYFYGTIAATVVKNNDSLMKTEGFQKVSNYTILIDLKKTEEELWKNLEKKSARWGANFAKKNNLVFELAKEKDVEDFYPIYQETAQRGGFEAAKKNFILSLRDTPISKFFVIKKDKKIIGGGLILIDKEYDYSILDLTASTDEGLKLQSMPFLYWNIIVYSKNNGLSYFDLGGYDKEANKNDKTYNINKFKERFGGQIVEQPFYSTNWKYPLLRFVLKAIKKTKGFFLKKEREENENEVS